MERAKRLGQYILTDKKVLEKIIEAAELKSDDLVLEIGPGSGVLTFELAKRVKKVFAIEKDPGFVKDLESRIQNLWNVEFILGDALKILPDLCSQFQDSRFKIIGNIPYYITGHLLRIIGELENKPSLVVLTIQKEVAERIIAQPFKMNMLAVSVQIWAKPKIISFVPPAAFKPQPNVDSAIIKLVSYEMAKMGLPVVALAKAGFKQPRKLLINNLSFEALAKEDLFKIFQEIGLKDKVRAQDLSLDDWQRLSAVLTEKKMV